MCEFSKEIFAKSAAGFVKLAVRADFIFLVSLMFNGSESLNPFISFAEKGEDWFLMNFLYQSPLTELLGKKNPAVPILEAD